MCRCRTARPAVLSATTFGRRSFRSMEVGLPLRCLSQSPGPRSNRSPNWSRGTKNSSPNLPVLTRYVDRLHSLESIPGCCWRLSWFLQGNRFQPTGFDPGCGAYTVPAGDGKDRKRIWLRCSWLNRLNRGRQSLGAGVLGRGASTIFLPTLTGCPTFESTAVSWERRTPSKSFIGSILHATCGAAQIPRPVTFREACSRTTRAE